jgi:hypothetical protein
VYEKKTPNDLRREYLEFLRISWYVLFPFSHMDEAEPRDLWYGNENFAKLPTIFVERVLSNAINSFFPLTICKYVFHDLKEVTILPLGIVFSLPSNEGNSFQIILYNPRRLTINISIIRYFSGNITDLSAAKILENDSR